ncbi:SAC domain-containing protein [Aphelenchoides besseyi]|nr:SAC domain-containing protein [Aphelenchoides besseyi]KAI6192710.1 SAC domain-containing protein [Aphelenchoides besseyi]
MQFFSNSTAYYIKSIRTVLKCCRQTATLSVISHSELAGLDDLNVLGDVVGLIGKIVADDCSYLLLILDSEVVGELGPHDEPVYRIGKVLAVPIVNDGTAKPNYFDTSSNGFGKLKSQQKKLFTFVANRVNSMRLIDEVVKMLNDSETFYYATSLDLTINSQRRAADPKCSVDEFFWNRHLLNEFFDSEGKLLDNSSEWVFRIIHGYFDQRHLSYETDSQLRLTLISRRSTNRAGVRFLRRGVDSSGHVANFVETELILRIFGHTLSFVQIRGSIPLFWSQCGYRYRPPLVIDKTLTESLPACREHFAMLKREYGEPIVVVNLIDQSGRELPLGEAFLQHILEVDDPKPSYYAFDFHDQCRALRFDKVSILLDAITNDLVKIGFCWIDKCGQMVREQKGVIRTNCVDCLDRTNVVQSAISQNICATQARKLGLIEPFEETPGVLVQVLQQMWADHGDCISKQYAGTSALKGDVTRAGKRKLMGLMKDGYNSASRYYLSHVRDAQRQRAIEALITGRGSTLLKPPEPEPEIDAEENFESEGSDDESDAECSRNYESKIFG